MTHRLWSVPARVPVKLFFAVRPDGRAGAEIENLAGRLQRAHRLKGRPIDRPRLHNTLASVHDTGTLTDHIRRAKAIGDRLWQRSFSVCFDWTGSFRNKGGRHPFVLRAGDPTPLSDLRAALRTQMLRDGFAVESSFTPHITMLWADRRVDEDYPVAPITWTVRDFVLMASLQGQSRHIEVARWRLE
jgi:2'-5' RNA ligase